MDSKEDDQIIKDYPIEERQIAEKELNHVRIDIKYRGTETDERDMLVLGRNQVLRVYMILKLFMNAPLLICAAQLQVHHNSGLREHCHGGLGVFTSVNTSTSYLQPTLADLISRNLILSLPDGGKADLFWAYIVGSCGMSLVYASLAEMSSM